MADDLTLQAISGITDPSQIRTVLFINNQQVHAPATDVVQVIGDSRYLKLTGGNLTGPLTINGAPVITQTTGDARYLQLSVGTLSGGLNGTSATWTGLLTTNGQVAFPATQNPSANPNTLDDYEEGTWTPTITAGSGTFTTVSAVGTYVKVGRIVHVFLTVTITTNGTAAVNVVATLPFTAASTSAVAVGRENNVSGNILQGFIVSGGATMNIFTATNTYPGGSGTSLILTGSYLT